MCANGDSKVSDGGLSGMVGDDVIGGWSTRWVPRIKDVVMVSDSGVHVTADGKNSIHDI